MVEIDNSRILFDQKIRQEYNVKYISGSDEAGRGAMAGPIVVASVILPINYQNPLINDSKKISSKLREILFDEITKNALSYSISILSEKEVDQYNPKRASILGMISSIKQLIVKPELVLLDGEQITDPNFNYKSLKIIKGDFKSQSIAAASILAKVTRDRIMIQYDKQYLGYEFAKHKGYCTLQHQQLVEQKGILPIHRLTYAPIKKIVSLSKK